MSVLHFHFLLSKNWSFEIVNIKKMQTTIILHDDIQIHTGISNFILLKQKWEEATRKSIHSQHLVQDFLVGLKKARRKKRKIRTLVIPPELTNDKQLMMQVVKARGLFLSKLSPSLQQDYDIVLAAASQNGLSLGVNHPLMNDPVIAFEAVKSNGLAFNNLPATLKNDRRMALRAAKSRLWYRCLPEQFRTDREIIFEMVKWDPNAVNSLSGDFLNDEEMILRAGIFNTPIISKLSHRLQHDLGFVIKCTQVNHYCFPQFPTSVKENLSFVKKLTTRTTLSLDKVPESLRSNLEIVENCAIRDITNMYFAQQDVWLDVNFMIQLIAKCKDKAHPIFCFQPKRKFSLIIRYS